MTFRKDPTTAYRERLNAVLNKGHFFAVVVQTDRRVVMTSRSRKALEPFANWTPGTTLIDVRAELENLPLPLPDRRIRTH